MPTPSDSGTSGCHPPPVLAAQDDEVAVVERRRAHFEKHVAGAGARCLGLVQDEVVVAEALFE
jgi:hypothetical protein